MVVVEEGLQALLEPWAMLALVAVAAPGPAALPCQLPMELAQPAAPAL